jgi:methyltransferase OMS1
MEVAVRVMGCGDHGSEHACGGEVDVGEENRRQSYDDGAATYDKDVCSGEGWMGMTRLRKTLLGKAKGRVLEVAAGTGANFPLYPTR